MAELKPCPIMVASPRTDAPAGRPGGGSMICTRNCLYQFDGACGLKLCSSDATNRCPLVPDEAAADTPYKPSMTNADHIRSMTDEELAGFHLLECPYMAGEYGECKYGWHDREQTCEECMLDWLKQPYEEENHGKA